MIHNYNRSDLQLRGFGFLTWTLMNLGLISNEKRNSMLHSWRKKSGYDD